MTQPYHNKQLRFNKSLIDIISPALIYLQSIGISNKFIENVTNNPNTKYYLSRNKYKDNIVMYDKIPTEAQQAAGIKILDIQDIPISSHLRYIFQLPNNQYLVITNPDYSLINYFEPIK